MQLFFTQTDLEVVQVVSELVGLFIENFDQILKSYKKISVTLVTAWKCLMQSYMLHTKGFNVLLLKRFVIQDISIYLLIITQQLMFLMIIQIELKEHSCWEYIDQEWMDY
jgi:hypothetical protein